MTPARVRRLRTTVLVAAVLASAPLATQVPAAAAPTASPDSALVVSYDDGQPLANASVQTVAGSRAAGGGCTFRPPELTLAPGETAVAARQIETNFSDCTTKIEIGTPRAEATRADGRSQRGQAESSAGSSGRAGAQLLAATSSAGYYRVWWEDFAHIDLNAVKTNVSWTWNNSCTSASNGSANYWWRTETGWTKYSSSVNIARSCYEARVYTDATFRNAPFCWPGVVWTTYDNVTAVGRYNGSLHGWVDSTSYSVPAVCPKLHFHAELRRTLN